MINHGRGDPTRSAVLLAVTIIMLFPLQSLGAQQFPLLRELNNRDPVFRQLSDDIQAFYRWQAAGQQGPGPSLAVYRYIVGQQDSLFSLAARLNLPQSSIATLNRLDRPQLPEVGTTLLIPNIPGVFIPDQPESDFERLLAGRIQQDGSFELSEAFRLPDGEGASSPWRFVVAGDFTSLERRAFLQVLFRDPLPGGRLTSPYGMRSSPITGELQFHYGIDLADEEGTPVLAAFEGEVVQKGYDPVYGNYLSIDHPGGYRTLYAHLLQAVVDIGDQVRGGATIGFVGSTGMSTGAHLHFEILYLGKNRNPQDYIRKRER